LRGLAVTKRMHFERELSGFARCEWRYVGLLLQKRDLLRAQETCDLRMRHEKLAITGGRGVTQRT
jgi:hypothetical protein